MPYNDPVNLQLCTFTVATDLAARLIAVGIQCGTIFQIDSNGDKLDTTDERWSDPETQTQYVGAIWSNVEQNYGLTYSLFEQNGYTVQSFTKLAASAGITPPEPAILALKGNIPAINKNLEYQMREK